MSPEGDERRKLLNFLNLHYVVGCGLVDVVIQPVGIEQIRAGAPADDGGAGGVAVGEAIRRFCPQESPMQTHAPRRGQFVESPHKEKGYGHADRFSS